MKGEAAYNTYAHWVGGPYPPKALNLCISKASKVCIPGRALVNSFLKLLLNEIVSFLLRYN